VRSCAQLKGSYIKIQITGDDFIVNGYQNEFKQVILNIINNAKDAIVLNKKTTKEITIKIQQNTIYIQDSGGGIPENILDRIFEPYFTTKLSNKGTGIGLYMSKIIIEDHLHGKLNATNSDNGAVFTIMF
jgi:signal transduction histidine kinase